MHTRINLPNPETISKKPKNDARKPPRSIRKSEKVEVLDVNFSKILTKESKPISRLGVPTQILSERMFRKENAKWYKV
jgi:hypothetical protein